MVVSTILISIIFISSVIVQVFSDVLIVTTLYVLRTIDSYWELLSTWILLEILIVVIPKNC